MVLQTFFIAILLFLSTNESLGQDSRFRCHKSLGQVSTKLHRSFHDQAAWFKDLIFPIEITEGSFKFLDEALRSDFESLCKSEKAADTKHFTWSVAACTDDILNQVRKHVSQHCRIFSEDTNTENVQNFPPLTSQNNDNGEKAGAAHTISDYGGGKKSAAILGVEWDDYEKELIRLSHLVNQKGSSDGEDFMRVGNSTPTCEALRLFTKMFMGQAAPVLNTLQPIVSHSDGDNIDYQQHPKYAKASEFLKKMALTSSSTLSSGKDSISWRDLTYYAIANIEHTVGAGRWDERAFLEAAKRQNNIIIKSFADFGLVREKADARAVAAMLQIFKTPSFSLSSDRSMSNSKKDEKAEPYIGEKKMRVEVPFKSLFGVADSSSSRQPSPLMQKKKKIETDNRHGGGITKDQKVEALNFLNQKSGDNKGRHCSTQKVIVVTVVSEDSHKLKALRLSAAHTSSNVELVILTTPPTTEQWSNDWKPRRLLRYLRSLEPAQSDTLILFVDGYDVLLSPNVGELGCLLSANQNKGVIFAAERDCWPDAVQCRWFTSAPFLNAGVFAGKAHDVLHMLESMRESYGEFAFCGEDQRAYQRYALDNPDFISLDETSDMFQCMHGYSWDVDILEQSKQAVLYETKGNGKRLNSGKTPLVLHFNSYDGKEMMQQLVTALGYE